MALGIVGRGSCDLRCWLTPLLVGVLFGLPVRRSTASGAAECYPWTLLTALLAHPATER